jgi:hypothetical protein
MRAKPDRVAELTAVTSPKPRAWSENGRPPAPADVAERAFRSMLQLAEPDDTERPGLLVTPARAARAWAELTAGYREVLHADQRGARHLSREGRGARRSPRAVPSGLTKAGQQDKR